MGKSYTELKKEFEQEWAKNLKLYIEAGMIEEGEKYLVKGMKHNLPQVRDAMRDLGIDR